MIRSLAQVTFALAAACGGTQVDTGLNDAGGTGTCSLTLSGDLTFSGNPTCIVAAATRQDGVGFAIDLQNAPFGSLSFASTFSGTFEAGTFTQASASVTQAATVVTAPSYTKIWTQSTHDSSNPDTGSFNLVVSSIGTQYNSSGGSGWLGAHGTLDATMTPTAGTAAASNVTMHLIY